MSAHLDVESRLKELGIRLPDPPSPVGAYVAVKRSGRLLFVSGQLPLSGGKPQFLGKVGADLSLDEGKAAARLCLLNGLAVLRNELAGDLDRVVRFVRLGVFVASDPGFTGQPGVADGASDLLVEIFGEVGRHARAAVGVAELPLNAAVEVELMVEVKP